MTMEKIWYAIQTYSGFEQKVKQNIEFRSAIEGFKNDIGQILIPTETVVEIKDGKKKSKTRNLMPGYMLIEMEPKNSLFSMIKRIAGVSDFVGDGSKPIPLKQEEVNNVLNLVESKKEKPKSDIKYSLGEQVKVVEGPFANFTGSIDEIDSDRARVKVMVSIFGRPTAVELDVLQVESLS